HQGRQTRYEIADLHLTRALTALVDTTLAVDEAAPCIDPACTVGDCSDVAEVSARSCSPLRKQLGCSSTPISTTSLSCRCSSAEAKDNPPPPAVSCWDNISDSSAFSGLPCLRTWAPKRCYLTKCCLILA